MRHGIRTIGFRDMEVGSCSLERCTISRLPSFVQTAIMINHVDSNEFHAAVRPGVLASRGLSAALQILKGRSAKYY